MTEQKSFVLGEDAFTLFQLLQKVAERKGLELWEGATKATSRPIKSYKLDRVTLNALAQQGIRGTQRDDGVFTIVDENPQQLVPGWSPSNYWNFRTRAGRDEKVDKLCIEIGVGFCLNTEKRGLVLVPQTHGTFLSPTDDLPNFRMFKALVDRDSDAILAVAREIAAGDGHIVVTWTNLGLGGIRPISTLFAEFARGRKEIEALGRRAEFFQPSPQTHWSDRSGGELFVVEPAQPRLFETWREQLKRYRESLTA